MLTSDILMKIKTHAICKVLPPVLDIFSSGVNVAEIDPYSNVWGETLDFPK